jgi:phosphoglycerate dehydrogenase-like enzyme
MRFPDFSDQDRPVAVFAMRTELPHRIFGPAEISRIRAVADLDETTVITDFRAVGRDQLASISILITGWGAPPIGAAELDAMPRLRAIIHAGGTVKAHVAPAAWDRGILVTTAASANAFPVAEYTLAFILLAGKNVPAIIRAYARDPEASGEDRDDIGNFQRTVGVISASRIGRRVIQLLEPFDFTVLLYDPDLAADDPILSRAERTDLDGLLRRSSIVTIHAPLLPETTGLLGREQLAQMQPGATLINTARAPIVDQEALAQAVAAGRLRAILDVTDPEPLPARHQLRRLDGVILTPHVAGALGNELRRLGQSATREIELLAAGLPAEHRVSWDSLAAMA